MTTHPPHLTKPGDLFVVLLEVGKQNKQGGPAFEPLGYGMDGQPAPDQLLRRGCRCTGFPSEEAAHAALKESAEAWKRDGLTFHIGKQVQILKVEAQP